MYAIIEDGSHQFRVREGDRIRVDRRDGKAGDELVFSKVLLITEQNGNPTIGTPAVDGARVVGKIINQFRAKKIIIQKFRRGKMFAAGMVIASPTPWSRSQACFSPSHPPSLVIKIYPICANRSIMPIFLAEERFFHF